jgi:hypothetical protein
MHLGIPCPSSTINHISLGVDVRPLGMDGGEAGMGSHGCCVLVRRHRGCLMFSHDPHAAQPAAASSGATQKTGRICNIGRGQESLSENSWIPAPRFREDKLRGNDCVRVSPLNPSLSPPRRRGSMLGDDKHRFSHRVENGRPRLVRPGLAPAKADPRVGPTNPRDRRRQFS